MSHTNIKLYGTNWCSDCKRSKKFLGEQRVHYDFINIEEDMEGQAFVQKLQNGGLTIPSIVFEDGSTPNSQPFKNIAKLDAQGFIMTGIDFQTSTVGIFAAGDVRSGSTKQLVSAAGEGAAAALAIREHLRGHDAHSMENALVGTASS